MLPFKHIATIDFETFYSDSFSLKKLATTDYVRSDEFETQTCAIKIDGAETDVYAGSDIGSAFADIDWSTTAFLAHHAQFDGLIASHWFDVHPCFILDTLSMARCVFGVDRSSSLKALCERLGRPGKVHAQALVDVKGKHLAEFDGATLNALAVYNTDDVEDTRWLYDILVKYTPDDELRLIDLTMRMYTEPTLLIDGERVQRAYDAECKRKEELFSRIGIDVKELGSAPRFAELLKSFGVEPPMKVSLRTGQPAYAFSKQDMAFKALLQHEDERVRWLVEARLASKSTLVETRSRTILGRVGLPTPIYLNHWGARTGRWSGGDAANWQNLPKRGLGGELRKSLYAPEGKRLVISDAAQIEARLLAWSAGQDDIVRAFANKADVYSLNASNIYGRSITKENNPDERFVGKVFTLGAGYGAGARKINYMLKIGAFGPAVDQPLEETERSLRAWRAANRRIVMYWRQCERNARTAFLNRVTTDDGTVVFEGSKRGGYMHMPNGTFVFYPEVSWDGEEQEMYYASRNGPVRFCGTILAENATQALARAVLGEHMLKMTEEMPDMRIATSTHDEVLCVVPKNRADEYAANVLRIMSTPPDWAAGLPLNADTHVADIYDKN